MIPRTIGEFPAGVETSGAAVPAPSRHRWTALRAARAAAAVAGLAVIGAYLGLALARLGYPFHLDILEGNSLIEMHRILAGQALYPAPSASYVPDGYPPLYFAVSAAAAGVLGQSYLPLRLVSLVASLACFAILGRLVRRETGSRAAGLAAAGLLAGTYFATGTWFDVARVDSLFLALSVAGLDAARRARGPRGAIVAGVLLGGAFVTKQSALAEGIAVIAALAAGPRRRLAVPAALAFGSVTGGSTLALGLASHGWYVYYVFQQMSQHALSPGNASQFWIGELLPTLGIAIAAAVLGARWVRQGRAPLVPLAGCAALLVEGFAARAQTGSNVNDLLPAYLAVALLAGLALGDQPSLRPLRPPRPLRPLWSLRPFWSLRPLWPLMLRRWTPVAASALVLAQLGALAEGFRLSQALPPVSDRVAGQRLVAAARELGGTVAIPADPGIAVTAGLPPTEDTVAAADVLRASDQNPKTIVMASLSRAVTAQRFTGIITEFRRDLRGFPADLPRYYHRCPQMPLDGVLSVPFSANARPLPVSVWLPIGHGPTCDAVARVLGAPHE